jgi:hypothetical protein
MTYIVSDGAASDGRRTQTIVDTQFGSSISRADAEEAHENCLQDVIELKRSCDSGRIVEVPICPTTILSYDATGDYDVYTYKQSYGDIIIECLKGGSDCDVTFPLLVPTCEHTTAVDLGDAGDFVILTKAGITADAATAITGDIGVSPIGFTAMTGFGTLVLSDNGQFSASAVVTGDIYAANYAVPTPAKMTTAVSNMEAAYTDAKGRAAGVGPRLDLGGGLLGGAKPGGADTPLTTGVYTFGSDVEITGDLYFKGTANDIFIIQVTGTVNQAVGAQVILQPTPGVGTPLAKNIFWQVAGVVNVKASAVMKGNLLVATAVNFLDQASLEGRILAQTACTLMASTITAP